MQVVPVPTRTHLDLIEQLVRIFGWPALLSGLWWAFREIQKLLVAFKTLQDNTTEAVTGVQVVQKDLQVLRDNHMAHLQTGIESVVRSNEEAVMVLKEIREDIRESSQNTALLLDRIPR